MKPRVGGTQRDGTRMARDSLLQTLQAAQSDAAISVCLREIRPQPDRRVVIAQRVFEPPEIPVSVAAIAMRRRMARGDGDRSIAGGHRLLRSLQFRQYHGEIDVRVYVTWVETDCLGIPRGRLRQSSGIPQDNAEIVMVRRVAGRQFDRARDQTDRGVELSRAKREQP